MDEVNILFSFNNHLQPEAELNVVYFQFVRITEPEMHSTAHNVMMVSSERIRDTLVPTSDKEGK